MFALAKPHKAPSRYYCWGGVLLGLLLTGSSAAPAYFRPLAICAPWAPLAFGTLTILLIGIALGISLQGSMIGLFVNSRNVVSLARAQMAMWTLLAFGALLGIVSIRLFRGLHPLDIAIPTELLEAMGIAAFTAAAAPALLSLKTGSADDSSLSPTVTRRDSQLCRRGKLIARPPGQAPSLKDFVMGDEVSNAGSVDLSKVQQIFVTLLLLIAYFLDLLYLVQSPSLLGTAPASLTTLPSFNASFVNLMLISHGGYLAYKAVAKPESSDPGLDRPMPPAIDRQVA